MTSNKNLYAAVVVPMSTDVIVQIALPDRALKDLVSSTSKPELDIYLHTPNVNRVTVQILPESLAVPPLQPSSGGGGTSPLDNLASGTKKKESSSETNSGGSTSFSSMYHDTSADLKGSPFSKIRYHLVTGVTMETSVSVEKRSSSRVSVEGSGTGMGSLFGEDDVEKVSRGKKSIRKRADEVPASAATVSEGSSSSSAAVQSPTFVQAIDDFSEGLLLEVDAGKYSSSELAGRIVQRVSFAVNTAHHGESEAIVVLHDEALRPENVQKLKLTSFATPE